jgi:hypothetical protein
MSQGIITFPPRNEPNAFFINLQLLYRDILRRPQNAPSYVDPEGVNVWLTEYFRFYLNGCTHDASVQRTLIEITTGISQATCGIETPIFPPRNLPNAFMNQLEVVYRDVLRRPLLVSYVDSEGANVWLAEYLRYRLAGCDHLNAEQKVFQQILGFGVQPVCSGPSGGGSSVTFNGTVPALGLNRHTLTVTGSGSRNANVRLTWSDPGVDLDLYGTRTNCAGDIPFNCSLLGFSIAESGTSEQMVIDITAGQDVYLWVDNFTNRAQSYTIVAAVAPGPGVSPTDDFEVQISPAVQTGATKPEGAPKFGR